MPKLEEQGIIVGCSSHLEWLLPWWWMHYSMHNAFPVTFFDFGDLSDKARAWCQERGNLVRLEVETEKFVVIQEDVPSEQAKIWKGKELDVTRSRLQWFKKPFACLQSPYGQTLWIDVDCQVRKNLAPLFPYCQNSFKFAVAEEPELIQQHHEMKGLIQFGETEYNTGVIAFEKDSPVLAEWVKTCIEHNNHLRGDQEALSRWAFLHDIKLPTLEPFHNTRGEPDKLDDSVFIIHWLGGSKIDIQEQIEWMTKQCFMDFSF